MLGPPPPSRLRRASSPIGGAETCLPLWGRRCPVDTVLRRPNRQARRCHRQAMTEGVTKGKNYFLNLLQKTRAEHALRGYEGGWSPPLKNLIF